MSNKDRIENGDYLFGIGLAVSDFFDEDFFEDTNGEKDMVVMQKLQKGEEADYSGKMQEMSTICKNEGFILTCSKFYCLFNEIYDFKYYDLKRNEIILIKDLDLSDDAPDIVDSKQIGITFRNLAKYFDLEIKELFFFFYFPEHVIINEDGEILVSIRTNTEWEHYEEFGEHED